MAGRRPKPTAVKALAGNPGKRKLNKSEPQFEGGPTCPEFLNTDARCEWNRIVVQLMHLNMLRSVDTAALAAYCLSYARWMAAEKIVNAEGQTIQDPLTNKAGDIVGYKVKRHPATVIAREAQAAMLRAAGLFGFDPSSRSRISLGEAPKEDAFAAFMSAGKATAHVN